MRRLTSQVFEGQRRRVQSPQGQGIVEVLSILLNRGTGCANGRIALFNSQVACLSCASCAFSCSKRLFSYLQRMASFVDKLMLTVYTLTISHFLSIVF